MVVFNLTDKDHVITAGVTRFIATLKTGAAATEQRRPASADFPLKAGKFVGPGTGKEPRKLNLIGRQNIDRVVRTALKGFNQGRLRVEAPQDQWRLKRHGGKGVDREANETSVRVAGGDNGYAGGELAERRAQGTMCGVGREHGFLRCWY